MANSGNDFTFDENCNIENSSVKGMVEAIKSEVDTIRFDQEKFLRLLGQKSNVKDVCALVDVKANTEDVFRLFEEIKHSIEILTSKQHNLEQSKTFAEMLNE